MAILSRLRTVLKSNRRRSLIEPNASTVPPRQTKLGLASLKRGWLVYIVASGAAILPVLAGVRAHSLLAERTVRLAKTNTIAVLIPTLDDFVVVARFPKSHSSRRLSGHTSSRSQLVDVVWRQSVDTPPLKKRAGDRTFDQEYEGASQPEIHPDYTGLRLPFDMPKPVLPKPGDAFISEPESQQPAHRTIETPKLILWNNPAYPADEGSGSGGVVKLTFTIDVDGGVRSIKVINPDSRFAAAAVAAISRWKYKPMRQDGQPLEAHNIVTVRFQGDGSKAVWLSGYYF